MKHLLIILALLFSVNSYSQFDLLLGAKYSHGLLVKVANKQIAESLSADQNYGEAYSQSIGFTVGVKPIERLGGKIEFIASQTTQEYYGKVYSGNSDLAYTSSNKITTLDIPVMVEFGKWIYVEGGPVFSIILDADFEKDVRAISNEKDVSEKFDDFSYGGAVGAGINIPLDHMEFSVGVRYTLGINKAGGVDSIGIDVVDGTTTHIFDTNFSFKLKF